MPPTRGRAVPPEEKGVFGLAFVRFGCATFDAFLGNFQLHAEKCGYVCAI